MPFVCVVDSFFLFPHLFFFFVTQGAHKRLITSPPVAVFPHPLASDLSFGRYILIFDLFEPHKGNTFLDV